MVNIKRSKKYHIIPIDYRTYNFSQLMEEINASGDESITWKSSDKHIFEVNDVCYIYYSDLPDGTSRILLKAVVIEGNIEDAASHNEDNMCRGIKLSEFKSVSLCNPMKFDKSIIRTIYKSNNQINQMPRYLDDTETKELLDKLIQDNDDNELTEVIEYFNNYLRCFFEGKDSRTHITFTNAKGVNYIEKHHFVEANWVPFRFEEAKWLKDHPNNLIRLCPNCHRQLHCGKAKDVIERLDMIYENNKEWYDKNFLLYAQESGYNNVIQWIYDIYNEERKVKHYDLIKITPRLN